MWSVVVAMATVEVVLQIDRVLAWRAAWPRPAGVDADAVLCVGEDLLFGAGVARADAVPAQLQAALRAAGVVRARVDNGCWPSRTSADILRGLPDQLSIYRPARLIVHLGAAERAVGDDAVALADLPGRVGPFAVGVATLAWLWPPDGQADTVGVDAGDDAAAAIAGIWHAGETELHLSPDGSFRLGGAVGLWSVGNAALQVELASGGRWQLDYEGGGDMLEVRSAQLGTLRLRRGPAAAGVAGAAVRRMAAGEWTEARWMLAVEQAGTTPSVEARVAQLELNWLEGGLQAAQPAAVGLLDALSASAPRPAALRGRVHLTQQRWSAAARDLVAAMDFVLGDAATFDRVARAAWPSGARDALVRAARQRPTPSARLLEAWLLAEADRPAAVAALWSAVSAPVPPASESLPPGLWPLRESEVEALAVAAEEATLGAGRRWQRAVGRVRRAADTTAHNVRGIVQVCRAWQVEPVFLLTIATPRSVREVVRREAERTGARCIDAVAVGSDARLHRAPALLSAAGCRRLAEVLAAELGQ